MSRKDWDELGPRTKGNLITKFADQDAAEQQRAQDALRSEEAFQKSMPDAEKLKRLNLTEGDWRTMSPDKRGEMLQALSAMDIEDRRKEAEAAMSLREKHPEVGALPFINSAAWGVIPYINRVRAQGAANAFNRAAAANVAKGVQAFKNEDMLRGGYALEQARAANRLAPTRGTGQPSGAGSMSYVGPAVTGAELAAAPEEIDWGQKLGTPNAEAASRRFLSTDELIRAALGAGASIIGREGGKTMPTQSHVPFPLEQTRPFIKNYGPVYKQFEQEQAARRAARATETQTPTR
jgi:hypothetical protein